MTFIWNKLHFFTTQSFERIPIHNIIVTVCESNFPLRLNNLLGWHASTYVRRYEPCMTNSSCSLTDMVPMLHHPPLFRQRRLFVLVPPLLTLTGGVLSQCRVMPDPEM